MTHGFARITEWDLIETTASPNGGVTIRFRLPEDAMKPEWSALRTEFVVTVTDQLTMELNIINESADRHFDFENCLHTYFTVGDIRDVSIAGLKDAPIDGFRRRRRRCAQDGNDSVLRITEGNQPPLSRYNQFGGNPR